VRHGRAQMPWGRYRGVRIRLIPDDYLSWLTTAPMMKAAQWKWLWDSVISELKYRGLKYELAATDEPVVEVESPPVLTVRRKFRKEL
jgi:uncharacterized protein (DUF3820 family)